MGKNSIDNRQPKYFIYARKSSESEDRQMASIDSQIDELRKLGIEYNLEIIDVLSESQSAKAPGRPIFNELLIRIQRGEANGILCWKLNRLARNPIDGGQISWLLQQGVLRHIQTYGKSYYPTDNVILMAVELGMANQFIRDLSIDTKRGLRAKAERGWYPTVATIGYIHNPLKKKGEKEIIEDPERFHLIRKIFDMALSGQRPAKVWEQANKWHLKTRMGHPIARSTIYRILSDPFYYGEFEYPKGSGEWHIGHHTPMVTREEFEKIQMMIGNKTFSRSKGHDFAFRGPLVCGECGASITAERKVKKQKNGVIRHYTYYHCTKRKNPACTQSSIEERALEKQIVSVLSDIEIPAEFHKWAMSVLREQNVLESADRSKILAMHRKIYDQIIQKIDNLIDLRANGEITSDEFIARKTALVKEKSRLEELLTDSSSRVDQWLETAEGYFSFAEKASKVFQNGTLETKKGILKSLGSNLYLKDGKLSITMPEPLKAIRRIAPEVQKLHARLEPRKNGPTQKDFEEYYAQNPILLRR